MIVQYLKLVLRIFLRSKRHSLIALVGLTIGLTSSFVTLLMVWQETHYDAHIDAVDQLYLVESHLSAVGRDNVVRNTSMAPLAGSMETAIPSVEKAARVWRQWTSYIRSDNSIFNQQTFYADAAFFDLYPVELLSGSLSATFNEPTTVMISRRMSEHLFGEDAAVGKTLIANGNMLVKVTAVYENLPTTSHLEFDMVSPINAPQIYTNSITNPSWQTTSVMTYVRLAEGASVQEVEAALRAMVQDKSGGTIKSRGAAVRNIEVKLRPVQDIHLYGESYEYPVRPKGDLNEVLSIFAIGLLVLIVACFNHINLSTAHAMKRAREVAIRKVVGASQRQLITQFLSEAAVYCVAAWVCALVLTEMFLPYAHMLVGLPLVADLLWNPYVIMAQAVTVLLVIVAAGFYPAIHLSRFMPQQVLKAETNVFGKSKISLRAILVVAQFAISIGLIIAAGVIFTQIKFTQKIDLGFDEKNLIALYGVGRGPAGTVELTRALETAMTGRAGILAVTGSSTLPALGSYKEARLRLTSGGEAGFETLSQLSVGLNYFDTYKIPMVAGRSFSDEFAVDRLQWDLEQRKNTEIPIVINEKAVAAMGLLNPQNAVGRSVVFEVTTGDERAAKIVGVVSNFHFRSLKNEIAPTVFYPDPTKFTVLTVRIDPSQRELAFKNIEIGWASVLDDQAVSSDYLEQIIASQYESETHQLKVVGAVAGLAIVIALLGLYGLAAFMMELRAHEVGIRKVLGAGEADIIYLMVWQFSRPLMVAIPFGIIGSIWGMTEWLSGFAYRISLADNVWIFVASAIVATVIAWVTVAGIAAKVARMNPIKALRYE